MESLQDNQPWRIQWYKLIGYLIVIGLVCVIVGSLCVFMHGAAAIVFRYILVLGRFALAISVFTGLFAIVLLACETVKTLKNNGEKLDSLVDTLNKNRDTLGQINQSVSLSENAKSIVFREKDKQSLRETIIEKLHRQDYDATYAMINEISQVEQFKQLAQQLFIAADKYRDATEEDKVGQVISYIEKLFDQYQWTKAAAQIERLRKAVPLSEKVNSLPKKLLERKEKRKRELLAAWDEAVKRQETERSLEVLQELDLYLTPSEGLALQESARDVFRTKLHNLGVQFSLEIADNLWGKALLTGETIMKDFPNSKMALEIRDKIKILNERASKGQ